MNAALPPELQRLVVRFLPRHVIAQAFHENADTHTLKYVRRFQFNQEHMKEALRPSHLKSVYYGRILRVKISQRENGLLYYMQITNRE